MSRTTKTDDSLIEEAGQGHNSFSGHELKELLEALERLNEEKSNVAQDIKAAMEVAAQKGFDKRTIREMLKLRAMDAETRAEREGLRDTYLAALGLID